jgi:hypothetical protein
VKIGKETLGFKTPLIPCYHSSDLQTMTDKLSNIDIRMTSYMVDLLMFFNTKEQAEKSLKLLEESNRYSKILTNLTNSVYIVFNDSTESLPKIKHKLISPSEKRKSICLLGSYFSITDH